MRWFKPRMQSIYNILGQADRPTPPAAKARLEAVRHSMLDIMTATGLDVRRIDLFTKIRFALTAESLWYARSDLMFALSGVLGEERAHAHIMEITRQFIGLLPQARQATRTRRQH